MTFPVIFFWTTLLSFFLQHIVLKKDKEKSAKPIFPSLFNKWWPVQEGRIIC